MHIYPFYMEICRKKRILFICLYAFFSICCLLIKVCVIRNRDMKALCRFIRISCSFCADQIW